MATLANAHFVDSDIAGTASGAVTAWDAGTQKRAIAHPQTYVHLEGEDVDVLDDGVVVTGSSVVSGAVAPAITGTTHAGFNYISTLQPSKLDLEQMGLILIKKITKAIVSFYNTLSGKVSTKTSDYEVVPFGTTLFSGIKEVPLEGGYTREGDIIVLQDKPLPMTCRGLVLNCGVHDPK